MSYRHFLLLSRRLCVDIISTVHWRQPTEWTQVKGLGGCSLQQPIKPRTPACEYTAKMDRKHLEAANFASGVQRTHSVIIDSTTTSYS